MLKRWGYHFKAAVFILVFRLLALQFRNLASFLFPFRFVLLAFNSKKISGVQSMFNLRRKTDQVIQLL